MTDVLDDQAIPCDPVAATDARLSLAALEIQRGVGRMLRAQGFSCVYELCLANGRRADVTALSPDGEIWIIEVKSGVDDFRADQKWPEYRQFCDRLLFAVAPAFPLDLLPADTGLVLADRFGGEIVRMAPVERLAAARRKAMLLRYAHCAARRAHAAVDPAMTLDGDL